MRKGKEWSDGTRKIEAYTVYCGYNTPFHRFQNNKIIRRGTMDNWNRAGSIETVIGEYQGLFY